MGQSFFTAPIASVPGGTTVSVTNFPSPQLVSINQATPGTTNGVELKAGTALVGDTSWSGALATALGSENVSSVGSKANRIVEAISAGIETDTLARPSGCSNFMFVTIFNNSVTLCTFTIGNANGTTGSVQPGATYNAPCNVSKLVLHATAANQQIDGLVYDPTVT